MLCRARGTAIAAASRLNYDPADAPLDSPYLEGPSSNPPPIDSRLPRQRRPRRTSSARRLERVAPPDSWPRSSTLTEPRGRVTGAAGAARAVWAGRSRRRRRGIALERRTQSWRPALVPAPAESSTTPSGACPRGQRRGCEAMLDGGKSSRARRCPRGERDRPRTTYRRGPPRRGWRSRARRRAENPSPAAPLVLYCGGGSARRSRRTTSPRDRLARENLMSVDGGIRDWRRRSPCAQAVGAVPQLQFSQLLKHRSMSSETVPRRAERPRNVGKCRSVARGAAFLRVSSLPLRFGTPH